MTTFSRLYDLFWVLVCFGVIGLPHAAVASPIKIIKRYTGALLCFDCRDV